MTWNSGPCENWPSVNEEEAELERAERRRLPAEQRCTVCHGEAVIYDSGHYVPGEQFVEPPSESLCPACLATGFQDVQVVVTELERAQAEVIRLRAIEQRAEELHHSVTGGGSAFSPTKPRERGIHEAACYILGREA